MTAFASPYTLLRRDSGALLSRAAPPPHAFAEAPPTPERRAGLLRAELARLVAARDFSLAFQPVARLADGRPVGQEALLRLRPPARPARHVVAAAAEWGLGPALDEAVLDKALALRPPGGLPVSVNVQAASLRDPVCFARLLSRLAGEGDAAGIEIGGLRAAADLPAVAAMAAALREAGVRVALDDVGADPLSLAALRAVAVDEIKFSGAVVGEAVSTPRGRDLLRQLARLAAHLGARPVAKLIETMPQARLMRDLGITHAQGWLFGAPVQAAVERRRAA